MPLPTIHKSAASSRVAPHLRDYERARAEFSWPSFRAELSGLPGGAGLNLAYEALDRHAQRSRANRTALRWLGKDGAVKNFSYAELSRTSNRLANVLRRLEVAKGDRVFTLLGRVSELYVAVLGTLKNISVFYPLFSQFGPEPIWQRLSRGDAKVLITTTAAYTKKIAPLRKRLPQLATVLLVDAVKDLAPDVRSLARLMVSASDDFTIPPTM